MFEVIAQTLLVINLYKIKIKISDIINKKILFLKIILVSVLIISAFAFAISFRVLKFLKWAAEILVIIAMSGFTIFDMKTIFLNKSHMLCIE